MRQIVPTTPCKIAFPLSEWRPEGRRGRQRTKHYLVVIVRAGHSLLGGGVEEATRFAQTTRRAFERFLQQSTKHDTTNRRQRRHQAMRCRPKRGRVVRSKLGVFGGRAKDGWMDGWRNA
mmetsp:Transcript_12946/g.27295  ORF Transcript_12946/g.27295 Transcript_12946/m.27295 type:complete len:119 (+) Transcript_12946:953-1309(+)